MMLGSPVPGRPTARREPPTMSISAPRLAPNTLALIDREEGARLNSQLFPSVITPYEHLGSGVSYNPHGDWLDLPARHGRGWGEVGGRVGGEVHMDAHQHGGAWGWRSLHPLPGSIRSFLVLHVQLSHRDGAQGVGCCRGRGRGEGGRDLRGCGCFCWGPRSSLGSS